MPRSALRETNPNWRGGRRTTQAGYVMIRIPDHPRAVNGYVREHVVIAERALGRPLPMRAEVHHFDEDKAHNARGNLVVCEDRSYHQLLHRRANALREAGDPNAIRCQMCGTYKRQEDIVVIPSRQGHFIARHSACMKAAKARRTESERAVRQLSPEAIASRSIRTLRNTVD